MMDMNRDFASLLRSGVILAAFLALGSVACGNSGASDESSGVEPALDAEAPEAGTAPAQPTKAHEPAVIARGEVVELTDHLVSGKITVFDFTSQYCPPCRQIEPFMLRLHREREDLAVVKVDINRPDVRGIDWRSPVAMKYRLGSIPAFTVYDANGKLMATGDQARNLVFGWLGQLENIGG